MSEDKLVLSFWHRGLTVYKVADPGWRVVWNRYPNKIIGTAVVTGSICWSFVWAKP